MYKVLGLVLYSQVLLAIFTITFQKCTPSPRRSWLANGRLHLNGSNFFTEECKYRCLVPYGDTSLKKLPWKQIVPDNGVTADCDTVEIRCMAANLVTYEDLHEQIAEKSEPERTHEPGAHNVFMLVIDSVSLSEFLRGMPKTRHFLAAELDLITFQYLNKVGLNSRPNGYAFLMGEYGTSVPPSPWNSEIVAPELCYTYLDDRDFVAFDFRDNGYRTMYVDDWIRGVFIWPNCKGFKETPFDHYMTAPSMANSYTSKSIPRAIWNGACRETFERILDTTAMFAKSYKGIPKFSIGWMSYIAHDYANMLYSRDDIFLNFFKSIREQLRDSFLIFMADHGKRMTRIRKTKVGELEDFNPFLTMSLPQSLRKNHDLVMQLHENSRHLISHYDLYATIVELAMENHQWTENTTFSNTTYSHPDRAFKGSSLFHPLPEPRNCETLSIPFDMCMCQRPSTAVDDAELATNIGTVMIQSMNSQLRASDEHRRRCSKVLLDLSKGIMIRRFDDANDGRKVYHATIVVKPSGGRYSAFVYMSENSTITLVKEDFPRLDSFALDAMCVSYGHLSNYCYCDTWHQMFRFLVVEN